MGCYSLNEMLRRKGVKAKPPVESPIRFVTAAPGLLQQHRAISGTSGLTPKEEREQYDIKKVALEQPHRKVMQVGDKTILSDDKRWASALGRFCLAHKPRPLGDHMYDTGAQYGIVVLEWKHAEGFDCIRAGDRGYGELDDAERERRRELARIKKKGADDRLWSVGCKPAMMERLCFDDLDIAEGERTMVVDGLIVLAKKWGYWPRAVGEER